MADALTAARKESEKRVNEVKEEKEAIRGQALKLKEKVSERMWGGVFVGKRKDFFHISLTPKHKFGG